MLELINYRYLPIFIQVALISTTFSLTVYFRYRIRAKLPKTENQYIIHFQWLFAPIYEEVIFRGIVLGYLLNNMSLVAATIISSLAFGLWHLKNVFHKGPAYVTRQAIGAALFYGPLFALLAYLTSSIWPSVILHYINNLVFLILYSAGKIKRL